MVDTRLIASLLHGLETRFLLISYSWCTAKEYEYFEKSYGVKPTTKEERVLKAFGARESQRIMGEFFFSWLVQIEDFAHRFTGGVVRGGSFDETMLYFGGQSLYELFAAGCIRGPYAMPWDNTEQFRNGVLRPAARLMRSYEHDETLLIPPEAKKLLELRGLAFDF